jgi:hypothetical protein
VLHDTDVSVQTNRKDYRDIEKICRSYPQQVTRLEAVQEIEAWLLADKGFCRWLGQTAKKSDHLPQPSKKLEDLINRKYGRSQLTIRTKERILQQHMDVTGEKLSQSMKTAMDVLSKLPCVAGNKP